VRRFLVQAGVSQAILTLTNRSIELVVAWFAYGGLALLRPRASYDSLAKSSDSNCLLVKKNLGLSDAGRTASTRRSRVTAAGWQVSRRCRQTCGLIRNPSIGTQKRLAAAADPSSLKREVLMG
jgi:hypothetical protein